MTPEDEFVEMIQIMAAWPDDPPLDDGDRVLARAGRVAARNDILIEAMRYVYCRHALAPFLRPLMKTLFQSVDDAVCLRV